MTRQGRERVYVVATWLLAGLVVAQITLAFFGLPVQVHAVLGLAVGCLALALLWWTRTSDSLRHRWILAALVTALVLLQPCFLAVSTLVSHLSIAHTINAFAKLGVALAQAFDSDELASAARTG